MLLGEANSLRPAACWETPELADINAACSIQGQWPRELRSCIYTDNDESNPRPFLFAFGMARGELDRSGHGPSGWEQTQ